MLSGRERPSGKLPSYDVKTIHQVLASRGIEVSATIFEEPKREAVVALLESLLSLISNMYQRVEAKEDVRQLIVSVMLETGLSRGQVVTPESLEMNQYLPDNGVGFCRAVRLLIILRLMQRYFVELFGIATISLNDIFNPSPKRVQMFCSALVDYIRFQEEHLGCFLERLHGADELQRQMDEIEQQTNQYLAKHEELEVCVRERQREKADLADQMEKNEAILRQLLAKSNELLTEVDVASEICRSSEDECRLRKEELQRLTVDVSSTEARVVSSPARIVQEMNAAAELCETEKFAILELEDRTRELKLRHGVLEHVRKGVHEAIVATAALSDAQLITSKLSRKAEHTQKEVENLQKELNQLDQTEKDTRLQNTALRNQLQGLEGELEIAYQTSAELLGKIKQRQSALCSGIEQLTCRRREVETQENALTKDCEELTGTICATKEQFERARSLLIQHAREVASGALAQLKSETVHLQNSLESAQIPESRSQNLQVESTQPLRVLGNAINSSGTEGSEQTEGDKEN